MKRRDSVPLTWKEPPEWDRFLETVADDNHGYTSPYAGIAIEWTWDEYWNGHRAKDVANRLLEAGGHSRQPGEKNKIPTRDPSGGTGQANLRIACEVRDEMAAAAAEMGVPKHEVLRAVVLLYLDGGLLERVADKLERVDPDAVKALEAATGGTSGLNPAEEDAVVISERLGPSFTEAELRTAIKDVTTGTSDYYLYKSRAPEVIDRKEVRRFEREDAPDLFLQSNTWDARMVTAIERRLGADRENDIPLRPFSKRQFKNAAEDAGLDVNPDNRAEVNRIKDRLLERHGFAWNEDRGRFTPHEDTGQDHADAGREALEGAEAVTDGGRSS